MAYDPANPFDNLMSGGFRSYNGAPANTQSMSYAFNPYYRDDKGHTGQLQLLTLNNEGALRVDIGTGISISANITGLGVTVNNPIAVTGGQIDVNGFSTLTGQVAQLQVAVDSLTGTISSKWQKTKTAGYADVYGALTGNCLVSTIQGYSKTSTIPSFIQVFDSATVPATGSNPDFVVATQTNNFFVNLPDAGVEFMQGVQIVNSSSADSYVPYGSADFVSSLVYKMT